MKTPRIPVAKEGFPFIFFSGFATLIFAVIQLYSIAIAGLIITAFILSFFRDPERFIAEKPHAVVSPADGKIISVEKIEDDKYLQKDAYKISVFMNVFNVHVNRVPMAGTVKKVAYKPGKFYAADSPKAKLHNESCATVIEDNGVTIACIQVAGLIARRIVNWSEVGDTVERGERFGLIRFGSRVDILLPPEATIAVKPGQKVIAGETVLSYLNV